MPRYFCMRAGYEEHADFLTRGYVSIANDTRVKNKSYVAAIQRFLQEVSTGDYILLRPWADGMVHYGLVAKPNAPHGFDDTAMHMHQVTWSPDIRTLSSLSDRLQHVLRYNSLFYELPADVATAIP